MNSASQSFFKGSRDRWQTKTASWICYNCIILSKGSIQSLCDTHILLRASCDSQPVLGTKLRRSGIVQTIKMKLLSHYVKDVKAQN